MGVRLPYGTPLHPLLHRQEFTKLDIEIARDRVRCRYAFDPVRARLDYHPGCRGMDAGDIEYFRRRKCWRSLERLDEIFISRREAQL